jgi:hypothetical protein
MSFDLSWLWDTLKGIVNTIGSWFSGIWDWAKDIVNTGQGIFSGLVAFGSQLWDGIIKAFSALGKWFYDAFNWIWQGLVGLGQTLGSWLSTAFQWLAGGIQWIANGIWSLGSWIYNGLTFIWNWIVNAVKGLWNAFTSFFGGIASAIGTWWGSVVNTVNQWFTNLVVWFRRKLVQTIMTDVSIYFGWKSMERLTHASGLKDAGLSLLGLFASPFVGFLFGSMINGLIPTPSTETMQIIPSVPLFSYAPPSLEVETPTEKIPPSYVPYTPSAPPVYAYTPVCDFVANLGKPPYEVRWDAGKDLTLPLDIPLFSGGRLFENNHTYEIYGYVYGNLFQGQTFTPTESHNLSSIILNLKREGNPQGNLIVVIYNVDAEGKPTGSPLASMQVVAGKIPASLTQVEFILPTWLSLNAGTTYAIVVKCPQGDSSNYINWASSNNNPYARGSRVYSTDGGATWLVASLDDFWFEEWGF